MNSSTNHCCSRLVHRVLPRAVPIAIEFVLIGDQAIANAAAEADGEFIADLRVGVEIHHQRHRVADQTLRIARCARFDASFAGRLIDDERRGQALSRWRGCAARCRSEARSRANGSVRCQSLQVIASCHSASSMCPSTTISACALTPYKGDDKSAATHTEWKQSQCAAPRWLSNGACSHLERPSRERTSLKRRNI